MQRRQAITLFAGAIVILSVIPAILALKKEKPPLADPVVRGKPMSRWVREVAWSGDSLDEAREAFRESPQAAAQHLVYVIRRRPSRLKQWFHKNWSRLPNRLQRSIQYPDLPDNLNLAVLALGELKLDDRGITKALVSCLKGDGASRDPTYRSLGARGLRRRAPLDAAVAIPALGTCLHDKSADIRVQCAIGLAAFGTNSLPFMEDLIQLVQSENEGVKWCAAYALGEIGPPARVAIPTLQAALAKKGYKSSHLSRVFAMALWRIDPQSISALPYLLNALESAQPYQKPGLIRDLMSVDAHQVSKALDVLTNLVINLSIDKWVRCDAAQTLGKLGGIAKEAVPSLCMATNESDIDVRSNVFWALAEIGQNSNNVK